MALPSVEAVWCSLVYEVAHFRRWDFGTAVDRRSAPVWSSFIRTPEPCWAHFG
jgi:hypothetical protein